MTPSPADAPCRPYRDDGAAALVAADALRRTNEALESEVNALRARLAALDHGEPPLCNAGSKLDPVTAVFLLGGLALWAMARPMCTDCHVRSTRTSAMELRRAAETWRSMNGDNCPTPEQLRDDKAIDSASMLHDPWGGPFVITCADDETTVRTPGPDHLLGTADDIVVPDVTAAANAP